MAEKFSVTIPLSARQKAQIKKATGRTIAAVKVEKAGEPDKRKFAKELQDVMRAVLHLTMYYNLQEELEASINEYYRRVVDEGLVIPLRSEEQ